MTAIEEAPRTTRAGRLWAYVREMVPLPVLVVASSAQFLGIYLAMQALAGPGALALTWRVGPGILTLLLLTLLLRVYDELKDVDTDLALGRAGDPRYKDRPIVTGKVRVDDIEALRTWLIVALVALNLPLGVPWPLAGFAVALGLCWLSSRWFFWSAVERHLLLAFATHNPLVLILCGYVVAVYVSDFGADGLRAASMLPLLGIWFPMAAWETSRKIRLPEDETDYQTYSKVLGWRVAALLPAFFIAASAALLTATARVAELGLLFPAALGLAATIAIGATALLLIAPTRRGANLRPFAEMYAVVANVGLALTLALSRGIAW